jgi:hypothetical protein
VNYVSLSDTQAYGGYCSFCSSRAVKPLSLQDWLKITDRSVFAEWERFGYFSTHDPNKLNLDADGSTIGSEHLSPHDRLALADMYQQFGTAVNVGVLRRGGSLGGVRPQTRAVNGEGTLSPLTARTCRRCKQFLPATLFSKKAGRITREICKKCDNLARVDRRRKGNQ